MSFFQGLFGSPNVEKLKAEGNVKGLITAMTYKKDRSVAEAAVKALAEIADEQTIPLLQKLGKEQNNRSSQAARQALMAVIHRNERLSHGGTLAITHKALAITHKAAISLAKVGDTRAIAPLSALIEKDILQSERADAITALEQIVDNEQVIEILVKIYNETNNKKARLDIMRELDSRGWEPADELQHLMWLIELRKVEKVVSLGTKAVEPLIHMVENTKGIVDDSVVRALADIGDARATEPIVRGILSGRISVLYGASALTKLGDKKVVLPLIEALKMRGNKPATSKDDKSSIIRALGELGDERAVEPLIEYYKDPHHELGYGYGNVTRNLGLGQYELSGHDQKELNVPELRIDVIEALRAIKSKKALGFLKSELNALGSTQDKFYGFSKGDLFWAMYEAIGEIETAG